MPLNKPVLFLVFNRPDTTSRVFAAIRAAKPVRLYVAADGPRAERAGEAELCAETRRIATAVDWPCEVKTLFREKNLGCGRAVSGAISWFFDNEPEGIILEDDCLPHPDFFPYCSEMLEKYRDNSKVMFIGATNFQDGVSRGTGSYYFSSHSHVWGWASWRRAWKCYDFEMKNMTVPELCLIMSSKGFTKSQATYWLQVFKQMKEHAIDTWDYQWHFSIWFAGGIAVIPNSNLVTNIGFYGAHYSGGGNDINRPCASILPLMHPSEISIDKAADLYFHKEYISKPRNLLIRILKRLKRIFMAY
jgi:hypothetical protein